MRLSRNRFFAGSTVFFIAASAALVVAQGRGGVQPKPGECPRDPVAFHLCALEKAKAFNPPRTADGVPDLQGYWRGQGGGVENIEAHEGNDDVNAGPTWVVDTPDGKIPYQPWALEQRKENFAKYLDPNVPCFSSGVPRFFYTPGDIIIAQAPGMVAMTHSRSHTFRVIPIGNAPPRIDPSVRLWLGTSRGGWDGNTLVVDVTNQNAKWWFDQAGNFASDAVHVVERFTLIDPDTIHYEARIEDPNVYTRPWTMVFAIRRTTMPKYEVWEEACHEGEHDTAHLLGAGLRLYPGISRTAR
jgi:hypothetical protein